MMTRRLRLLVGVLFTIFFAGLLLEDSGEKK